MNYIFTPYSLLGKDPKKFKVKYRKHAFKDKILNLLSKNESI